MKSIFKIPSTVICPNCGEKYFYYISSRGRQKGILSGEYFHESLIDPHYGNSYDCYSCNYHWKIRISKKSLLVRIFPFLENK